MTLETQSLDITNVPELASLADEVRRTGQPCRLRRGDEEIAMVVPLGTAVLTPMPYNPALAAVLAGLPEDSVVVRTAGILHTDQPFLGYEEEREAAAEAMAREAVANWEE